MKWKKRAAEINRLKAKHGRDRSLARSFPDLSVKRVAPTSDRMDQPTLKRSQLQAILGPGYVISNLHKSGYQVFPAKDLPQLGGKKI